MASTFQNFALETFWKSVISDGFIAGTYNSKVLLILNPDYILAPLSEKKSSKVLQKMVSR